MSWPETLKGKCWGPRENSELRTYNSELGKAGDSELVHAASHGGHEADEQSTSVIGLRRKNSMARIHA
jgi:hypothetical protein